MKRHLLLATFVILVFSVSAQFTKGEKVLSGNISFSSNNNSNYNIFSPPSTSEYTYSSFGINTNFGWVKSSSKISGIRLSHYSNTQKLDNSGGNIYTKITNNGIGVGLFNQHIKELNKHFFSFLEYSISGNRSWSKTTLTSATGFASANGFGANVNGNVGIGYRISPRFITDITLTNLLSVNYSHTDFKSDATPNVTNKQDTWGAYSGLSQLSLGSFVVGFRWVFN